MTRWETLGVFFVTLRRASVGLGRGAASGCSAPRAGNVPTRSVPVLLSLRVQRFRRAALCAALVLLASCTDGGADTGSDAGADTPAEGECVPAANLDAGMEPAAFVGRPLAGRIVGCEDPDPDDDCSDPDSTDDCVNPFFDRDARTGLGPCECELPAQGDAGPAPDTAPPAVVLKPGQQEVTIADSLRGCSAHRDCVLVDTGCNGCCQRRAINLNQQNIYASAFEDACATAEDGPECSCAYVDVLARCDDGQCHIVLRSQLAHLCYSPSEPETAYDDGAVGCSCDSPGQQICVGGAALGCYTDSLTGSSSWISGEDGPCEPRPDECPEGTVVATMEECLELFSDCYQRDDDSFCGAG